MKLSEIEKAWELMNREDNYYSTFASFAEMPGADIPLLIRAVRELGNSAVQWQRELAAQALASISPDVLALLEEEA